jgi:flagellar biosynthesis GTPase FlhF
MPNDIFLISSYIKQGVDFGVQQVSKRSAQFDFIVKPIRNLNQFIQQDFRLLGSVIISVNLIFFAIIDRILRRLNISLEDKNATLTNKQRIYNAILFNVGATAIVMGLFNKYVVSQLLQPMNHQVIFGIAGLAACVRLLMYTSSAEECRWKQPQQQQKQTQQQQQQAQQQQMQERQVEEEAQRQEKARQEAQQEAQRQQKKAQQKKARQEQKLAADEREQLLHKSQTQRLQRAQQQPQQPQTQKQQTEQETQEQQQLLQQSMIIQPPQNQEESKGMRRLSSPHKLERAHSRKPDQPLVVEPPLQEPILIESTQT